MDALTFADTMCLLPVSIIVMAIHDYCKRRERERKEAAKFWADMNAAMEKTAINVNGGRK